jgi:exodeoxyribonuclease VII large subunit
LELRDRLLFLKSHLKHPRRRLEELSQRVDDLEDRLILAMTNGLTLVKKELTMLGKTLRALSPLAILERGYSITYRKEIQEGQVQLIPVRQARQVALQSELEIWLAQGKLGALVMKRVDR